MEECIYTWTGSVGVVVLVMWVLWWESGYTSERVWVCWWGEYVYTGGRVIRLELVVSM